MIITRKFNYNFLTLYIYIYNCYEYNKQMISKWWFIETVKYAIFGKSVHRAAITRRMTIKAKFRGGLPWGWNKEGWELTVAGFLEGCWWKIDGKRGREQCIEDLAWHWRCKTSFVERPNGSKRKIIDAIVRCYSTRLEYRSNLWIIFNTCFNLYFLNLTIKNTKQIYFIHSLG